MVGQHDRIARPGLAASLGVASDPVHDPHTSARDLPRYRDTMEILGRRVRRPVRLGSLRRTAPISTNWGYDRGSPVDRYYIEAFLEEHRMDVRGACLEVADDAYIRRFDTGVTSTDVLDVDGSNPHATIVADLTDARHVESGRFDCFILTQTLQFVYDVEPLAGSIPAAGPTSGDSRRRRPRGSSARNSAPATLRSPQKATSWPRLPSWRAWPRRSFPSASWTSKTSSSPC